jgi:hypothetical protein
MTLEQMLADRDAFLRRFILSLVLAPPPSLRQLRRVTRDRRPPRTTR